MQQPDSTPAEDQPPEGEPDTRPYLLIRFAGPDRATMAIEGDCTEAQVMAAAWVLDAWAREVRIAQVMAQAQAQASQPGARIIVPIANRQARRHPNGAE